MAERGNRFLRLADFYAGIPLSWAVAAYRKLSKPQLPHEFRKAGIICPGAIGDLLLVSALANGLKKKFPQMHLEVLTSNANAMAAQLIADIDESRAFSIKDIASMVYYVRSKQYDALFDTSQWARIGNIVTNLSNARMTIGFKTRGQYRSAGYDICVEHRSDGHELDNFIALGKTVWPDFEGYPQLLAVHDQSGAARENNIFCHMWTAPGPGRIFKEWPASSWAELIENLLSSGYSVFLTGGPADASATRSFLEKYFPGNKNIHSLAGSCDLPALAQKLVKAQALISVNTGIMHFGALMNVPTVALHGATNPMRWGPVGKYCISLLPREGYNAYLDLGFEYPPDAKPHMDSLPVSDVLDALAVLKDKSRAP